MGSHSNTDELRCVTLRLISLSLVDEFQISCFFLFVCFSGSIPPFAHLNSSREPHDVAVLRSDLFCVVFGARLVIVRENVEE